MSRLAIAALALPALLSMSGLLSAELPCDRYPSNQQTRCETIWKQINAQAVSDVAKFGMDQLKRRQEGKITAEQHLRENQTFIKQSAEQRLKLLDGRMSKDQAPTK